MKQDTQQEDRLIEFLIVGLSLLFPIILYVLIRAVFCTFMELESMEIVPLLFLLLLNLVALVYVHYIDIRNIHNMYGTSDKLIAAVFLFQPAYFIFRQEILGRSKTWGIIYAVVSVCEIAGMLGLYIVTCVMDVVEYLM